MNMSSPSSPLDVLKQGLRKQAKAAAGGGFAAAMGVLDGHVWFQLAMWCAAIIVALALLAILYKLAQLCTKAYFTVRCRREGTNRFSATLVGFFSVPPSVDYTRLG